MLTVSTEGKTIQIYFVVPSGHITEYLPSLAATFRNFICPSSHSSTLTLINPYHNLQFPLSPDPPSRIVCRRTPQYHIIVGGWVPPHDMSSKLFGSILLGRFPG